METINLTALAKFNRGTTPATRSKLEKLGVNPVEEVVMPSGRKFVLFDKVKAVKALEKSRAEREKALEAKRNPKPEPKKPVNSAKPRQPHQSEDIKALLQELQEIRSLNAQLLEAFTRPQQSSTGNPVGAVSNQQHQ
jgi:hypothetical protein